MAELLAHVRRCKELARVIKARIEPPWPTLPTTDLPPRDLANQLIDRFLRTAEAVHRVVHIPTLRRECDAVWSSTAEPDMSLIVTLKLVMAIGAASYDREFSLREQALRWIHEAMAWLSRPEFKSRLGVKYIQTSMLLIKARAIVGVGWSMVWVSMGELLRSAIFAGLHRDPSLLPRQNFFASELRRRLWNTLIEMDLQSSLDTGALPILSMHRFDTQPPGNYDDDQLEEDNPTPRPEDTFTDMSIARALRRTYPVRLAIAKFLNEIGSAGTYKDTLQLDAQLRAAYKPIGRSLKTWKPSEFQATFVDSIMRRSLLALHIPFFAPSLTETAYAYTRRVAVDNSLILWRALFTPSDEYLARMPQRAGGTARKAVTDFSLLMAFRSGSFRGVTIQTANILLAELRAQVQENDTLGPGAAGCADRRVVLEEAQDWSLGCIRAGETNIKGYLLICMIGAQIEALRRGAQPDEMNAAILQGVVEAKDACVPILEERAAQARKGDQADADALKAQQSHQPMDDWDLAVRLHPVGKNRLLILSGPEQRVRPRHHEPRQLGIRRHHDRCDWSLIWPWETPRSVFLLSVLVPAASPLRTKRHSRADHSPKRDPSSSAISRANPSSLMCLASSTTRIPLPSSPRLTSEKSTMSASASSKGPPGTEMMLTPPVGIQTCTRSLSVAWVRSFVQMCSATCRYSSADVRMSVTVGLCSYSFRSRYLVGTVPIAPKLVMSVAPRDTR